MSPEARAQAEKWGWGITQAEEEPMLVEMPMKLPSAFTVTTPAQTCATTQSRPLDDAQVAALEKELAIAMQAPERLLFPKAEPQAHCAPTVLLGQEEHERAMAWGRMVADLPSADPPTDHGCRLANYIARQERRRNWTLTHSRRVNRGDEGAE